MSICDHPDSLSLVAAATVLAPQIEKAELQTDDRRSFAHADAVGAIA